MWALIIFGFLLLICFGAIVLYLAFFVETLLMQLPGRVLYHASDLGEQGATLEKIVTKYITTPEKYVLVEPGAGLGKVAEYLSKAFTWKEVVAVEMAPVIFTVAHVRKWFHPMAVRFVRKNIFDYTFPKPACIYCYLTTPIIDELYKKEAFKQALVITLTFPLTGVQPTETIALKGWQGKIFIYDFR